MGMAQHVQLVVTEELLHLVGLEQLVIVSTINKKSRAYGTSEPSIPPPVNTHPRCGSITPTDQGLERYHE